MVGRGITNSTDNLLSEDSGNVIGGVGFRVFFIDVFCDFLVFIFFGFHVKDF